MDLMDESRAGRRRRPIRVAYVTARLDPGGAERQMLLLAEGLPKTEFAVEFVCLQAPGAYADRARAAGARVHVLAFKGPQLWSGSRFTYLLDLAWNVVRFVRLTAWRYDVIDAWLYHAYVLTAVTRPVAWPRALVAGRRSLSGYKARFNRLQRLADRIATDAADVTVANSDAVRADVANRERRDSARILVIHNAVLPPYPISEDERRTRRAAWGASDSTVVIGSVANYKRHKGVELLVRATAALVEPADRAGLRLVLVGEGPLRDELAQLIRDLDLGDVVVLHGREREARTVYGAFDVFAFASEAEGFPNVVLEAAAAGLPIVTTAAGGTVEIVTEGQTGFLVPIGDERALVVALRRVIDDPAGRRRMGAAAQRDVLRRYGGDRMVEEFAALYRSLARGGRRPWRRR
jgi:glycosyltransferase involved in cell wall biosynthesis